ncbi:hypothetical protein GF420_10660 [candidate division GN15 bacterium]|nr:hypothetical protein [candidate division GN15 bacterium]
MPEKFSYDWTRFVLRIELAATPDEVFGAWTDTEFRRPNVVSFTFGNRGEKIRVRIRKSRVGSIGEPEQFDMNTTPKEKVQMHMGCRTGWVFFLANSKAWLEHGVDLRSHDPKKSYRQSDINS